MTQRVINIDLSALPQVVNKAYHPLYADQHRYLVMVGGAGSGKSVFAVQKVLGRLMTEKGHLFAVCRKVARWLRVSVFKEFNNFIFAQGWQKQFRINKSDMTITFIPTGASIVFLGLDDVGKMKSISGVTGMWIEEATELSKADFEQLDLRIRGHMPNYKQIILSFNPISNLHWLKQRFFDTDQHGLTRAIRTTYRDNEYLDSVDRLKIELLAELDPQLYKIYGMGEWGVLEGVVYDTPVMLDTWPTVADDQPRPVDIYGLDFGFNNPCSLIALALHDVSHVTRRGDVYLREELYETGLDTTELIGRMDRLKISKRVPIYADSAEPDRIKQIKKAGYNCKPAHKGPSSVLAGIDMCRSLTLHTLRENTNLNAEFGSYVWGVNKSGDKQDNPVPFNDHALDAMRYAIWTYLRVAKAAPFDRSLLGI